MEVVQWYRVRYLLNGDDMSRLVSVGCLEPAVGTGEVATVVFVLRDGRWVGDSHHIENFALYHSVRGALE